MNSELEIRRAIPEMENQIADFFHILAKIKESVFFQPHPFTSEQAFIVANYKGKDFYAFAFHDSKIIGYGMLRGWDEGYVVPSLGISIHPDFRGMGIGLVVMNYLHAVAVLRGCRRVRLRVRRDNAPARRLYEKLGYQFEENDEEYIIGFLQLKQI